MFFLCRLFPFSNLGVKRCWKTKKVTGAAVPSVMLLNFNVILVWIFFSLKLKVKLNKVFLTKKKKEKTLM